MASIEYHNITGNMYENSLHLYFFAASIKRIGRVRADFEPYVT